MSALEDVSVQMSVVLGSAKLPIRQVLKMGRGAMIPLDCDADDPCELHVNGVAVALGKVLVTGERMSLEITGLIEKKR